MKPVLKRNILIGITVVVSVVVLYWGIEYLKGVNLFKPANFFYASFEKVDGITIASPVKVNGFQVGQVHDIQYDYASNKITLELSFDKQMRIPKGSTITMVGDLLGSACLCLQLSQSPEYYKIGDVIPSQIQAGLMDKVGQDMLPAVSSILPKVDSIMGSVNGLLSNPALQASVTRIDAITAQLAASSAQLTALLTALNKSMPGVVQSAGNAMNNVEVLTADLKTTTTNVNELTTSLNNLPLDSAMARINTTLANIEQLTAQLNNQNSTLGAILNDKQLYQNAVNTVASLDSLLVDIKRNPKRYISIKVF